MRNEGRPQRAAGERGAAGTAGTAGTKEVHRVRSRVGAGHSVLLWVRHGVARSLSANGARHMTSNPTPPGSPLGSGLPEPPRRRRTWLTCLLVTIGVVLLAVGGILGFVMFIYHDY